jgi:uncharacterized protein with HEPN domain
MSRDDATLLDILKAARLVTEFKGKLAKQAFLRDIKTQSAILHQLLVIGERFLPSVEMTTRSLCPSMLLRVVSLSNHAFA